MVKFEYPSCAVGRLLEVNIVESPKGVNLSVMSSYRQIIYHIIFRTKNGSNTLNLQLSNSLYAYIVGIVRAKKCHLYRINGTENHLHLLTDLHPDISLSAFIRDIKTSSSLWLKKQSGFKNFEGWASGYGAFTLANSSKERVIAYIKNQREHHMQESFSTEYERLLINEGIEIDKRYFLL